ncbi:MAG: hypothetical protein K8S21_06725 [Gemmatimonadetes bacterium]|nr:hypothetical protein [Gemmatimonadota bacterium]
MFPVSAAGLLALAPRWRFLDSGAGGGNVNMATDAALMAQARRTGIGTFRIYGWNAPTLSLGRHERARDRFDGVRLAALGVDVVRRPTGGRALLHDREVTYSVTAPLGTLSLGESYAVINALLLDALARLGVQATVAVAAHRPLRPEGAACFAEPGAGELTVGGAKLVGSAQWREDGALLQHGSILLADDQSLIDQLRSGDATALPATVRAATLGTLLGREVGYDEVRNALAGAFTFATGTAVHLGDAPPANDPSRADASFHADLARLTVEFSRPSWTWRR